MADGLATRFILPLLATALLGALERPATDAVVVCLGDSITDGNTWPQIAMQALREHGAAPPAMVCAGVGGDTAAKMLERYDRDVAAFRPAWVAISAGTNDALHGVSVDDYLGAVRGIAMRVRSDGGLPLLLTPCTVGSGRPELERAAPMLDAYAAGITALGRELGVAVADVHAAMRAAAGRDEAVFTGDGIHPGYHGQELIARAVLDAWGWQAATLPKRFAPQAYPGLVASWEVRRSASEAWKPYLAPESAAEPMTSAEDWAEQCRRNGFAVRLGQQPGSGAVHARATIRNVGGDAWISLGGAIRTLSVNGERQEIPSGWSGYHAGHIRIPVRLAAGDNQIEAEADGMFLVLVTPDRIWERGLR